VVRVIYGHSTMSPFDKAHTTSYLSSMITVFVLCIISDIRQVINRK